MKRKFIGLKKTDRHKIFFLFWIPVWKGLNLNKWLQTIEKNLKSVETTLSRIEKALVQLEETCNQHNQACRNSSESYQLAIHDHFYKLYTSIQNIRSVDLYARLHHPETFLKYKGLHKGKDIVVVGAGPTLNDYEPIAEAVHIGVNRTYLNKKLELDYLFMQDGGPNNETDELTLYRKGNCRKFFGVHPLSSVSLISETYAAANEAERYYFFNPHPLDSYINPPVDLAIQPLTSSFSTVIPAFQFALWCRPRRIYIVGCDCSQAGYFAEDNHLQQALPVDGVIQEWQRMATFAKRHYPDVEIVSVNPVGLKGLFKDIVMKAGEKIR